MEAQKEQYVKDAQAMSTKSRFGFFNIYPSHTAGITDTHFAQKTAHKDKETGKVVTEQRGIYSGTKPSKVLSKTCFSMIKSPLADCQYQDPGRALKKKQLAEHKKRMISPTEPFRPAKAFEATLSKGSYEYKCIAPLDKAKMFRDENGRVKTENLNICSSPLSRLVYKRSVKDFKYIDDPYQNAKIKEKEQLDKDLSLRGQEPFRKGSPVKDYFSDNKVLFDDTTTMTVNHKEKVATPTKHQNSKLSHQAPFRPSSGKVTRNNGLFEKVTYTEEGSQKQRPQSAKNYILKNMQSFKTMTKVRNSRPSPSISLNRSNMMRRIR